MHLSYSPMFFGFITLISLFLYWSCISLKEMHHICWRKLKSNDTYSILRKSVSHRFIMAVWGNVYGNSS